VLSAIPLWVQAAFWGLLGGLALLIGAGIGYFANLPQRLIAAVMAFGSGVLISALAFELMDEAYTVVSSRPASASSPEPPSTRLRTGFCRIAGHGIASAPAISSQRTTRAADSPSPSALCSTAFRSRSSSAFR
jgi:zinc transporter ZupT